MDTWSKGGRNWKRVCPNRKKLHLVKSVNLPRCAQGHMPTSIRHGAGYEWTELKAGKVRKLGGNLEREETTEGSEPPHLQIKHAPVLGWSPQGAQQGRSSSKLKEGIGDFSCCYCWEDSSFERESCH